MYKENIIFFFSLFRLILKTMVVTYFAACFYYFICYQLAMAEVEGFEDSFTM